MTFLVVMGSLIVGWGAGAVVVIAIWGDPDTRFPPMGDRHGTPTTRAIALTWPFWLLVLIMGALAFGAGRLGMRLHRRRERRKAEKAIPRAKVEP